MEIVLYDPEAGYYATAVRRSGRAGDFHTNVDVGTLFGTTVAVQLAEMAELVDPDSRSGVDLVEAGAGDGRLMRDILDAMSRGFPAVYERLRVTLVERSAASRSAHAAILAAHRGRIVESRADLPTQVRGMILANELLDALPIHAVQIGAEGVREIYVTEVDGALVETIGPVSNHRVNAWVSQIGVRPPAEMRLEAGLEADDWIGRAGSALDRGFLLLFDYAHAESELVSHSRSGGTLMAYRQHVPHANWLNAPGECDITSHVNLGALLRAATAAGLMPLGILDQTYFLMNLGIVEGLATEDTAAALKQRLAARSLLMPGGLGSTMKAMAFGKSVGTPRLRGFSNGRLT